jgi:hypothetical protein
VKIMGIYWQTNSQRPEKLVITRLWSFKVGLRFSCDVADLTNAQKVIHCVLRIYLIHMRVSPRDNRSYLYADSEPSQIFNLDTFCSRRLTQRMGPTGKKHALYVPTRLSSLRGGHLSIVERRTNNCEPLAIQNSHIVYLGYHKPPIVAAHFS